MKRSLFALLLFSFPVLAQSVVLPREVAAKPGAFIVLKADAAAATVRWQVLDPGLEQLSADLVAVPKTVVLTAGQAGRYRVVAWIPGDVASVPALALVVVGQPGPTPTPTPPPPTPPDPTPPTPTPPAPTPTDPTVKKLQDAYQADPDPKKRENLLKLAQVLGGIVPEAKKSGATFTNLQLVQAVTKAVSLAIGTDGLAKVRLAAGEIIRPQLPADEVVLTEELWAKFESVYGAVAKALGQVTP